jgi:hypothetical protein
LPPREVILRIDAKTHDTRIVHVNVLHAAVLALVGWYLMVPPGIESSLRVDPDAPIGTWVHYGSYDSANECEENIHYLHQQADKFSNDQRAHPKTLKESEAAQFMSGECIATDDPRLKGN